MIEASRMSNGVVNTTVTIIHDDAVELDETFSVVGRVMESGLIADGTDREFPVVFQSPLDISITSDDGKSWVVFCFTTSNWSLPLLISAFKPLMAMKNCKTKIWAANVVTLCIM